MFQNGYGKWTDSNGNEIPEPKDVDYSSYFLTGVESKFENKDRLFRFYFVTTSDYYTTDCKDGEWTQFDEEFQFPSTSLSRHWGKYR